MILELLLNAIWFFQVLLDLNPDQAPPPHQPPQASAAVSATFHSNAKTDGPVSVPAVEPEEATLPPRTHQLPAETSTEYFSRMEALLSDLAPGLAQDSSFPAAAGIMQLPGSDIEDIIARSHRLGAVVGSLGVANTGASGSTQDSPELDDQFLDWATGLDLTKPAWEATASHRESPPQPSDSPEDARFALEDWCARFGSDEDAVAASWQLPAWEHARFDDEAYPASTSGLLPGDLWACHDSDDSVLIHQSGQASLASLGNGQVSGGRYADEEDIDALVERFRQSYAQLQGLSDSDSGDGSSDAALPDSLHGGKSGFTAQHDAAERSVAGNAGERLGMFDPLQDGGCVPLNSTSPAGSSTGAAEETAAELSETAAPLQGRFGDRGMGPGQIAATAEDSMMWAGDEPCALLPGSAASAELTAGQNGQLLSLAGAQDAEPGSESGSSFAGSSGLAAAADTPATAASLEQPALHQEPAREAAEQGDHGNALASQQAGSENFDVHGEEQEGTWGDRCRLADSAYTLQEAVHSLSKGSALALFASPGSDRIKAARGVASAKPVQALASAAAAPLPDSAMTKLADLPVSAGAAAAAGADSNGEAGSDTWGGRHQSLETVSSPNGEHSPEEENIADVAAERSHSQDGGS
jgi:hypothetical protein